MRSFVLSLVLMATCDTGTFAVQGDVTDDGGSDTDITIPSDTDVAADTDVAQDTDGGGQDTDQPVDTDPGGGGTGTLDPFSTRPLHWVGQRDFTYSGFDGSSCSVHVDEEGPELTGADTKDLKSACKLCTRFFLIGLNATGECTREDFADETYRGLEFKPGGRVTVHVLFESWNGWDQYVMSTGSVSAPDITYRYQDQAWGYRGVVIDGAVELTPQ